MSTTNKIISYFDLTSDYSKNGPRAVSTSDEKKIHWFPQYIALVLGIIVQPFLQQYMATGNWDFNGFLGRVLASLIIGIMGFPAVYKRVYDQRTSILIIQLFTLFTAGMGWNTLCNTALTAAKIITP
jgi:hypothetical protein